MKVIKRDGRIVDFDATKIERAILAAFQDVDGEISDYAKEKAENIASYIEGYYLDVNETPGIEEIQDLVEKGLMSCKRKDIAKAYILYRETRNKIREKQSNFMEATLKTIKAENIKNANANVDELSFGGRKFEAAGLLMKKVAMEEYINPIVAQAFKENRIYIHDMDNYATGMHNCLFVDLARLLREGFTTRNGDVRPANSINTAFQLTAVIFQCQSQVQFGGVASAHIDFDLAPYVRKSFRKHYQDGLKYIENKEIKMEGDPLPIDNKFYDIYPNVKKYALDMTEKETNQAAQAFFHNMNTLESRAGSQVPFSSINFGRDISLEGRMVIKALLNASLDGIGKNHRTSIFPISIFQYKKGVNANPGDPNYDLKQLAIKSLCKRIYPNFVNCDFSGDHEEFEDPDTYSASMGCRTRMGFDRHGLGWKKVGRGNISPVTINLPKIGIKYGICLNEREEADLEGFYKELREVLEISELCLLDRYKLICSQKPKSGAFMYDNNTVAGFDGDNIESAVRHGTQAIGFVGLAETCQALFGKNQIDKETRKKALDIVKYIFDFTKEASERNNLNFSCYFTPAESCAGKICKLTKEEFGEIKNITDREYFTNSVHVPVWEKVGLFEKIDIEKEFNPYGLGGQITYCEVESKIINNPEAIEKLIDYAMDNDICYFAVNFPIDTCLDCGLSEDIVDTCPVCGSHHIEHLARITGYLTTSIEKMNKAKQAEVHDRFKHSKNTNWENINEN